MNAALLTSLALWMLNLALAAGVFFRAPRKAVNYTFSGFVVTLCAWAWSVKMGYLFADMPSGLWWGRLTFVASSLGGAAFVLFCKSFPDRTQLPMTTITRLFTVVGLLMAGLSLTPWVLIDIEKMGRNGIQSTYGPLHPLFGILLMASLSTGIGILVRKWWRARGRKRLQIQYLCLGLGLFFAGSVTTNIIIPIVMQSSRFSEYGPYFSLFVVGLTAHAIIRHRLMNMRLVIRKSVTYGLSLGIVAGVMWSALAAIEILFDARELSGSTAFIMSVGMGSVMLFHPLRLTIQNLLDKYGYREASDYRRATSIISRELPLLMRIGPLNAYLSTFLLSTFKVEFAAIYTCASSHELSYQAGSSGNEDWAPLDRVEGADIIELISRIGKPILREEIEWRRGDEQVGALIALFADLQSSVLVPLMVEHRMVAIIAMGEKLSGDPFFQQDVELLTTIEHQASVALRRAELYEEVAWMHEYNENILRQMKSGVIAVNAERMVTVINDAAVALLQMPSEQFLQRDICDILDVELSTPLLRTLTGNVIYTEHETAVALAAGQTLPLVLGTSILHGPDGELAGAILVFHDLSRVKEMAEEKQRIERLASVGAFAGKIAHEIKNPLVAIKTLAELLPDQYDDEEFRTTFAHIALQEVERIDSLVRRLRGLRTSGTIEMKPLDILAPLEETLTLVAGEMNKRQIEVTRDYEESLPPLVGSFDQLKQVFLNICLNSAEAMGQSGNLHIAVGVETVRDHTDVIIKLSDNGPGIKADVLDTIFEAFVTSKRDGSGLGMAICKDIVELHRGTIRAANRDETSGAVFTIRLPASQGDDTYESHAPHHGLTTATHPVSEFAG